MTPEQAASLMQQAIRLQEQEQPRQALALYAGIIAQYPEHPDVLHNCSLARLAIGELGAAESLLLRAIRLRPKFDRARANLVKLWTRMDRSQTLAEVVSDGAWLGALDFEACMALGEFFQRRREFDRSIVPLQRAVAIDPAGARALHLLGTALYRVNAAEEGEPHLREALRLMPQSPPVMVDLARCLFAVHLRSKNERAWTEGRELIERATALEPTNVRIRHEWGRVLEEEGEFDRAEAAYREALSGSPRYLPALTSLAAIARAAATPDLLVGLEDALSNPADYPPSEVSRAWQALGKCHDAQGHTDKAFGCFEMANRAVSAGRGYDRAGRERYVDNLVATYSAMTVRRCWPAPAPSGRPVFIVGMPRSGTTLLEHMLAAHPQIRGAGELPFFTSLERTHGALHDEEGKPVESWSERLVPEYRRALRKRFDAILGAIDSRARYVTDKMPFNFSQLGMITWACPDARIIHCTRDRLDVGLSCFIESFHETHSWSLSLADIGHYYRQYERLMAHWTVLFQDRIHGVTYESLVADRDETIAGVLQFLGLDWDEAMTSYIGNRRPIRTPSNWQVRQPVYASSVGRWKRYQEHLGPLLQELGGD
jgi:tetratricopeptide (TPR) repeat protein